MKLHPVPITNENLDQERHLRFKRLNRRNNFVMILRFAIPVLGLLVAGFLIFQIILTNIYKGFGISGLRVEQDQVVIDNPSYGGVAGDGTRYSIVADGARISVSNTDIINLQNATITIQQTDGYEMIATTATAQMDLSKQLVIARGVMYTEDSQEVVGEFNNSTIDWAAQTFVADGEVKVEFKDGAIIIAQSLVYDAATQIWDFGPTIYKVSGDGGI